MSETKTPIDIPLYQKAVINEQHRILSAIDDLIHLTEDCPLYEGEERFWLLSAYRQVRRLMGSD